MKTWLGLAAAGAALGMACTAQAGSVQVDLSAYVNQGFDNGGWFVNGAQFSSIAGSYTKGNQGSPVTFFVANRLDTGNNFWYGLDNGSGTNIAGPPGSLTIPVNAPATEAVYTLTDNTIGTPGATEFSVTFDGAGGSITDDYVGGVNTKNYDGDGCVGTGCAVTPGARYWFIDQAGGQWLQVTQWVLPTGFGLTSVTFNQVDATDGAIVAGLTLSPTVPEPAGWALMLLGVAGVGLAARRSRRAARAG